MRSLGANLGASRANSFQRQADGYEQTAVGHTSSRTDPDDAERLTGIYGLEGWGLESLQARHSQLVGGSSPYGSATVSAGQSPVLQCVRPPRRPRKERTIEDTRSGSAVQEAAVRLRADRRNRVMLSLSADPASRCDAPGFTRLAPTRRIRRCARTGALLTVIGLMRLARGVRSRWRPLLAGAVLTVLGVMLPSGTVILAAGLWSFAYALVFPAGSGADRKRRYELERELPVYSIPADCHQVILPY